jgi:uncharacterized protein YdiU (UPF0061 family)
MISLPKEKFDNRFVSELPGDRETENFPRQVYQACWSEARPTPVISPRLVAYAPEVAGLLDISVDDVRSPIFAEVFSGNKLIPGMQPYAACYGGHQFGNWAGQLGDGRAIGLGEVINRDGKRWEIQLKGAGLTPYSRTADGRAVLRSSIREFLCSEAMHHLGVPTTRALSLVTTGEAVIRDMLYDGNPRPEPGAVVCRVAPSFIRFGNFEIFTARRDLDILEKLVDFTIDRDFPEISGNAAERRTTWFRNVCERTAILVAHWMRVGFVHGVLNTDNMSILGLTLDYGPYGWIDNYDPDWTPNTTDFQRHRYAFGQQPDIARWNLTCLANAIAPVMASIDDLRAGLALFAETFRKSHEQFSHEKFGFHTVDDISRTLITEAFGLMEKGEVDMTLFFRLLGGMDPTNIAVSQLHGCFYNQEKQAEYRPAWADWLEKYGQRLVVENCSPERRRVRMEKVNPCYVLRNYLAQEAIDLAEQGDYSRIQFLMEGLAAPYVESDRFADLGKLRPDWARAKVGCSMLSCSS